MTVMDNILEQARKLFLEGKRKEAAQLMMRELGFSGLDVENKFNEWRVFLGGNGPAIEGEPSPNEPTDLIPYQAKIEGPERKKEEEKALTIYKKPGPPGRPRESSQEEEQRQEPLQLTEAKKKKSKRMGLLKFGDRSDTVWVIASIIIGMTISALIGSMFIFFAFLCLAGYILVPDEDEIMGKALNEIKDKYIKKLQRVDPEDSEQAARIKAAMDADLENQRTIEQLKFQKGVKYTSASAKYLLKFGFFILFSLGFVTSAIPLVKPLGLFLGFLGYFMEGT